MSEPPARPRAGRSVFARLVAIMLTMAASLLVLVAGFFLLYVGPVMNASIHGAAHDYVRVIAAMAPSEERAKELGAHHDVQIRYEGPGGGWTTAEGLPTIAEARRSQHSSSRRRHYYVAPAPDGGAYLFAWTLSARMQTAHVVVPIVLLFLIAAVVFAAHGWLKRLLLPLTWLGDGVAGVAAGNLDVVVPKRSADEFGALTDSFNQMVGRVREMVRARDQLLLDVSHELRSPVTRLKVALELTNDSDNKARMAADLAEMEILIGELLELERLRDPHRLQTTVQNIVPILTELAQNFSDRPPGIRVNASTREILVDIDGERIRIVFRNLLENAIKYSLPDSRPIEVSATIDGHHMLIRVTDDGPGVPEQDMPNLFEPFFRVDRSRSKKTGGYGLGLSIAKRIVEAHGGTIRVANNTPRGASFVVTIPKASDP